MSWCSVARWLAVALTMHGTLHVARDACHSRLQQLWWLLSRCPKRPPPHPVSTTAEKVRLDNQKVLVHCMSGLSKSPAVVVYYLMRHRGWRLSEAYSWVKDRRPAISITAGAGRGAVAQAGRVWMNGWVAVPKQAGACRVETGQQTCVRSVHGALRVSERRQL